VRGSVASGRGPNDEVTTECERGDEQQPDDDRADGSRTMIGGRVEQQGHFAGTTELSRATHRSPNCVLGDVLIDQFADRTDPFFAHAQTRRAD
jgi:hypothetical protein